MIPRLAALLCFGLVGYLFWHDIKNRDGERISWMPLAWMFLAGSRWASSWLSLGTPLATVDAYSEGSPVDRLVFFSLILWGAAVLARRQIHWGRFLSQNKLVVLYFLFCLSSLGWTDEPFVLVKRWIKDLGNPIVVLVLLTERDPYRAVGITLRRLAFLLLPLSLLFVRYFPELGRTYHVDGTPMYTGVGHQKNDLGLMCLVTGIYFAWKALQVRGTLAEVAERFDRRDLALVLMLAWLLRMCNSQTSLFCLIIAILLLLVARTRLMARKPTRMVPAVIVVGLVVAVIEPTFQVKNQVLELLGRDPTLTNRVELWDVVLQQASNPLLGAGFMSFWAGDRMAAIWEALGGGINQAHNGYLEQYVNLGYVGVGFIIALMLVGVFSIGRHFNRHPSEAVLRLCFLIVAAFYNYTEASFYGINNMWVLFLLAIVSVHGVQAGPEAAESPVASRVAPTVGVTPQFVNPAWVDRRARRNVHGPARSQRYRR